jgi:hypothetical protein
MARFPLALLALALKAAAQDRPDPWRPRTVPLVGASYAPGVGLLLGAGVVHTRYGFHALPPSTRVRAEAEYATAVETYRVELAGEFRRPLAPSVLNVELLASGLELIRFFGFGNETVGSGPDSSYEVRQRQVLLAPSVTIPLAPRRRLTLGPLVKYAHTDRDTTTLLTRTGPYYGAGDFGAVGARVVLESDTRDSPGAAAQGAYLRSAAEWHPAAWEATRPFGSVSAEAATYLSLGEGIPPAATLALRAGGGHVSGTVPFHEVVYIGGETTVRGYPEQRFAGRTGAYANAELRLLVGRPPIGDVGVFGLADAGRVWVVGESSDRWHAAAGGGLWFAWQHRRSHIVTIAAARSPERTAIYVRAGFLF